LPREIAVTFTDTQQTSVSEASVYRLLKAHDLITSPCDSVIPRKWISVYRVRVFGCMVKFGYRESLRRR
jgi:hypothetical protein